MPHPPSQPSTVCGTLPKQARSRSSFCLATMFNGALAFGAFFLPGFMWRFSLVPCSGGWSWKPDSLGFHWRTAAFNLQLRLGHCRRFSMFILASCSKKRFARETGAPACAGSLHSRRTVAPRCVPRERYRLTSAACSATHPSSSHPAALAQYTPVASCRRPGYRSRTATCRRSVARC